ncbi:MAG: radical SAM protein [Planctomycetes bacterium]|nr:radical SAM protein [Planctomycetota bacterium]
MTATVDDERYRVLSRTRAIDPRTRKPVPALVLQSEDGVFLEKMLPRGERRRVQIEKDPEFYRAFADPEPAGESTLGNLYFYVTSRCNLSCPVCYEANRDVGEPSLESMGKVLGSMSRMQVLLCGAEPTCREELPEIISLVNQKNTAYIITNGIKLADWDYCLRLKEAGLKYVILSFNGLTDDVYRTINGRPLLREKMAALENLRELGMEVFLSITIARGVNDSQIPSLAEFYLERPFIRQIRFRAMAPLGTFLQTERIFMSELLTMVCDGFGIDRELAMRHFLFMDRLGKALKKDYLRPRLCSLKMDLNRSMRPIASEYGFDYHNENGDGRFAILSHAIRAWGLKYALRQAWNRVGKHRYVGPRNKYRVSLRVWPDRDTMDLGMGSRCMAGYWRDGRVQPFCLCNAQRED